MTNPDCRYDDDGYDDDEPDDVDDLHLVFRLKETFLAFPAVLVQDMIPLEKVVELPDHPDTIRGMINWRGKVIPLVDTRALFGMPSMESECLGLFDLMNQREQDHRNWLMELDSSLAENRPFKLATDPHKCAFGRWYDSYKTNNNAWAMLLSRFDAPHKKIHAVAHQVLALAEQNQREEAFAVIERTRATILGQMIEMFEEFRQGLSDSRREIAAITELNGQDIAFAIDSAEAIQSFAGKSKPTPDLIARSQNRFLDGVAEFGDEQTLVLLLNLEQILDYCGLSEEKSGN